MLYQLILSIVFLIAADAQYSRLSPFDRNMVGQMNAGREIPQFPLEKLPPLVEERLAKRNFTWDTFPGFLQLGLLFNTGYIFDANNNLIPFYTKCNKTSLVTQLATTRVASACNTELEVCRRDQRLLECPSGNLTSVIECAVAVPPNQTEYVPGPAYIELNERNVGPGSPLRRPIPRPVRRKLGAEDLVVIYFDDLIPQPECNDDVIGQQMYPCVEYDPEDTSWCPPLQEEFIDAALQNVVDQIAREEQRKNPPTRIIVQEPTGSDAWIYFTVGAIALVGALALYVHHKRESKRMLQENLLMHDTLNDLNTISVASHGNFDECQEEWLNQLHATGTKLIRYDEIQMVKKIGAGSYGEVFLATFAGVSVAIKKVHPWQGPDAVMNFSDEIALSKSLIHPNIVQFIGIVSFPKMGLCSVSEYMELGDLRTILENEDIEMSWADKKTTIAMDSAAGLSYLHNMEVPILHRDLKSRNILINEHFRAKLADFGLSTQVSTDTMTIAGSYLWLAPEILRGEKYSEKGDIYSFGIVLSEIETGELPYSEQKDEYGKALTPLAVAGQAANHGLRPRMPHNCPLVILDLFRKCVHGDPQSRPSADEVGRILHKFREDQQNENQLPP